MTITTPYTPFTSPETRVSSGRLLWRVDDELWSDVSPIFRTVGPAEHRRISAADDRRFFNGLIWLLRTGAQWRALPAEFGPKSTLHARFQEWVRAGAFDRALHVVSDLYGEPNARIDEAHGHGQNFRRLLAHWDREPANVKAFEQLAELLTIYRKRSRPRRPEAERLAG